MKDTTIQNLPGPEITDKFSLDRSKRRFEKLFGYKHAVIERLFSGKKLVDKRNLMEEDDMELVLKIARDKCDSVHGPILEDLRGGMQERRQSGGRRVQLRRDLETGAMIPERRKKIRREEDQEYFESMIFRNAEVPIGYRSYPLVISPRRHFLP